MKLYIVTARYGTSMKPPVVFRTREEAEKNAHDYVYDAAKDDYVLETEHNNPTDEELEEWAKENGYELWDYYYWGGDDEAFEADVTKIEV